MIRYSVLFSLLLLSAALIVLPSGCNDNSTGPSTTQTPNTSVDTLTLTIAMAGNIFTPASPTIAKHTTITRYNNSSITHTSTSNTSVWNTGDIAPGASKTTIYDTPGTFPYHCIYHPMMVGTITVQ